MENGKAATAAEQMGTETGNTTVKIKEIKFLPNEINGQKVCWVEGVGAIPLFEMSELEEAMNRQGEDGYNEKIKAAYAKIRQGKAQTQGEEQ